jgi:putative nucleotidyltransferase with HDIG domain
MKSQKLIDSIVREIDNLPPMPASIAALLNLLEDDNSSYKEIEKIISTDQSLTMDTLKICNSAYSGLRQNVTSIKQAVSLLGLKTIKSIAIGSFVQGLQDNPLEGYLIEKGKLWEHSMSVAGGSKLLAEGILKGLENAAFTAGIVHDIGKIIMSKYLKDDFVKILSLIERANISFCEAEKKVLGVNHADIGAIVSEKWKLPPLITDVIKNHHNVKDSSVNKQLVSIVHIADGVSMILGMTGGLDSSNSHIDEEAVSTLNLDRDKYEDLLRRLSNFMLFGGNA